MKHKFMVDFADAGFQICTVDDILWNAFTDDERFTLMEGYETCPSIDEYDEYLQFVCIRAGVTGRATYRAPRQIGYDICGWWHWNIDNPIMCWVSERRTGLLWKIIYPLHTYFEYMLFQLFM